jgi:hypothetical protein
MAVGFPLSSYPLCCFRPWHAPEPWFCHERITRGSTIVRRQVAERRQADQVADGAAIAPLVCRTQAITLTILLPRTIVAAETMIA